MMESPPPSAESAAHRGFLPTPFLSKTYQMVDDPDLDNIISWNDDGSTFIVWQHEELASKLLPRFFKHCNFASFVRQLNTYGFNKTSPDRWEFSNNCFRRGEKKLLCDIHRRKSAAAVTSVAAPMNSDEEQVLSSNSFPGMAAPEVPPRFLSANLMEENERLRRKAERLTRETEKLTRENAMLKEENGQLKDIHGGIMMLMSKYSASQETGEVASPMQMVLDLMPSGPASDGAAGPAKEAVGPANEAAGARLFGVAIGVKRSREDVGDEKAVAVKSEAESSEAAEPRSWALYRAGDE